ncbi:cysteine ABC transporter ATP-binding protein [Clostridium botulinum]|uniref:Cysteine ABC transporter ATP-binding protein n=1 Tax=Clostridium botulinum C/D str. DC5 TaxID=1443128 RepID=A0A0A0IGU5_CLOBO|nr:ABC transporter ATP-binding protein/permease [Clostridium botulinum]KEI07476.1 cysteine ABC transporter ATP-binding protein [Clostridium botulinum C/D str. BKT75002]KEI09844.1 cysteine ABC transporter ATP-binding protein [Clostridium botulinum C/D str. BKT2873]KGM97628.1 cysteine ABC transporter ATP-binding protein [Clostridium botulinum D str. CCUG 7971]KGN00690.1 cysteine ABC transporter ATP-binding protein [Clostridium botulinum C/D str. DC5]KOC51030.1 cysteine ABC transporter ATP-bindin
MVNKRLINLVEGCKKWVFLTVLMNWISLILNIISIIYIGHYIQSTYLYGISLKKGLMTLGILISAIFIRFICNYMAVKFSSKCSEDARISLRNVLYNKLLELGVHYNESVSTSEVVQVAIDGIEQLEMYFGKYLPQFFYSLLAPITLFIVLSFINVKAALVLILCVPLIPISIVAIMKIAKKLLSDYWGVYVNLGDTFLENLQGLTTLKIYSRDEDKNQEMNLEAERFRRITMKVLAMQLNSITLMDLIAFGGSAIGIIIALKELSIGNLNIQGTFSIMLLSAEFFIPLRLLGSFFHVAMNGIAASEKIFKIIDSPCIRYDSYEAENFDTIDIQFSNVSFGYEKERKILNSINLNIEHGKITAIVGESGCGKSTISNMIMGFYKEYTGDIKLNNTELRNINDYKLRKKINVVNHNSYIFTGTIEDNLKMAKENATEKEIYNVLRRVNLYDFVIGLPKGLKSKIKEGGSNLSGGQKQRLALARALLYDSEIYIFDEATSNIDVESEDAIMKVIYDLKEVKTVILISHRLYNVRNADNIYVLSKGEIVENGNHQSLMENKDVYFKLVSEQQQLEKLGAEDCA